jgi:hypothetical protein
MEVHPNGRYITFAYHNKLVKELGEEILKLRSQVKDLQKVRSFS